MNRHRLLLFATLSLGLVAAAPVLAQQDGEENLVSMVRDMISDDHPLIWTNGFHVSVELPVNPPGEGYGWGFSPAAGVEWKWKRLVIKADASYGFVRKVNDNDQVPNEKGHTRSLGGDIFLRLSRRNYFGIGASWGETDTTPYRKYAWSPTIAFMHEFHLTRFQVSYFRHMREYTDYPSSIAFTPGPGQPTFSTYCICSNGVSGVDMEGWTAMPAKNGLRFFQVHYWLTISRFHDTVTDPYNLYMTRQQMGNRWTGVDASMALVYRR
jgi:hypothetical protein